MSNEATSLPTTQPASTSTLVPADFGLPGLGLSMQLAGSIFSIVIGAMMVSLLTASGGSREMLWIFILGAAAAARSLYHAAAGRHLLYDARPMSMIPTYFVISAMQTLVTVLIMVNKMQLPLSVGLGIAVGLMLWPSLLFIVARRPRFRDLMNFTERLPNTQDKSFEGLAIIMTIFGATGVLGVGGMLFMMLKMPSRELQQGPVILLMLGLILLFIRSVLHVRAGLRGVRETDQRSAVELINQYTNFGIIAAGIFGAVLFMLMVQIAGRRLPMLPALTMVGAITWALLLWPMAVRNYVSDRQFADLMADRSTHVRAVDGGLSVLGWFLLGNAMLAASMLAPSLFTSGRSLSGPLQLFGGTAGTAIWMSLLVIALQVAASHSLITASVDRRVVASVYAAVAVAVQLYNIVPMWRALSHDGAMRRILDDNSSIMLTMLAVGLVVPVVTAIMALRDSTLTAKTRIK